MNTAPSLPSALPFSPSLPAADCLPAMDFPAHVAHSPTLASLVTPADLFGGGFEVLVDEGQNPHQNMEFDHERAVACSIGAAAPMLRLYSWQPWAVSLGAHQREYDVDADACAKAGYALVRRPTGGRAVLHANELTYSVVVPLATALEPRRTIHDVYRDVHILLLKALHLLGARAVSFEKTETDLRSHYRSGAHSMVCFSSSARYELTWLHEGKGKKVVGSAQKLYTPPPSSAGGRAVVLQHGSILLGGGHEQLANVARAVSVQERAIIRAAIEEKSTTLEEICGHSVSFQMCADAVQQTFLVNG